MSPFRRPGAPLFVLAFGAYAYFYQAGGWNQNSRFDLVRSLVEDHSTIIDATHRNTGDKSKRAEHYYCDKAPGVSLMAVPAYAILRAVQGVPPPGSPRLDTAAWVVGLTAVALPSALAVVMMFLLAGILCCSAATSSGLALAYGFATLAFPYATLFYGHQVAAVLLLAAFALLARARARAQVTAGHLALVGLLLGWAVVVEYPTALIGAVLFGYAASFVRPFRRLVLIVAGGVPAVLTLAAYHTVAFGGPATLPYSFSTQKHRHMGFFMGLGTPDLHALVELLFTSRRGLFYSAPWLLLAVPGAVLLLRRARTRPEGVVCVVSFLLFLWLNTSLVDWDGGWTFGARYLVPALPFVAAAVAGVLADGAPWRRATRVVTAVLAAVSAALMLIATAVKPEVPSRIARPFQDYLLPILRAGQVAISTQGIDRPGEGGPVAAWNLGQKLGLTGLTSLVPLALFALAVLAWLGWSLRRPAEVRPPS